MTLSSLEADLYRRLGYDSTPAATVTTRLRAFLNETHREMLAIPGMDRMRDAHITVTATADQEHIALPQAMSRVIAVVDRTNSVALTRMDVRRIRAMNPNQTSGIPYSYGVIGYRGVALDPSDASDIFVDSTSASDTNTAYMEGVRTGGYRDTTSVTMTGTTAVGFDTPDHTDWIQIDKFYLSAAAVGTVTLHEDASGGTELARIPIGGLYARYLHILMEPVPSSALTYDIDYVREVEDMANATDEPLVPPDFHRLLAVGARMKEYERREDTNRYRSAQTEYLLGIRDLKYWLHTMGGGREDNHLSGSEFSQLGANFPPGS